MLLLIDTRTPRPQRPPRTTSTWVGALPFIAGLVLVISASTVDGAGGLVLAFAGFFLVCRTAWRALGDFTGLRDHRQ
jgi:hypothetical protein